MCWNLNLSFHCLLVALFTASSDLSIKAIDTAGTVSWDMADAYE
jgi:hypothetical protein